MLSVSYPCKIFSIQANENQLHELLTEKAYPEMCWGLDRKTLRWHALETLEQPRCVHVRTTSLLMDDNVFAQVCIMSDH